MSRKPAALSASLVAVKGSGTPSPDMLGRDTAPLDSTSSGEPTGLHLSPAETNDPGVAAGAPLNFRVSETFRREFKVYAAQHGLKLNELLRLSFEAYRRTNDS